MVGSPFVLPGTGAAFGQFPVEGRLPSDDAIAYAEAVIPAIAAEAEIAAADALAAQEDASGTPAEQAGADA
jgi:hypothetical protein